MAEAAYDEVAAEYDRWVGSGSILTDSTLDELVGVIAGHQVCSVACGQGREARYLALMDIPNLDSALESIARILRPGGWFVFSITHPCFKTPATGELVDHTDNSVRRFEIDQLREPPRDDRPVWLEVPQLLYVRCHR